MSKFKYEVEVPKCFVEVVEYVYSMSYDEVIDRMHSGQIDDEIWHTAMNIESYRLYTNVDDYHVLRVEIDKHDYYDTLTFTFYVSDRLQMQILVRDKHSMTVSAVVAWLLRNSHDTIYVKRDYLECLTLFKMKHPEQWFEKPELTPYAAIPYLVEHKDVEALGALCQYAVDNGGIEYLLEKLHEVDAIEEKAFVLNWMNAHNAYIHQKFEL